MRRCVGELVIEREFESRADQRVLRWFGNVSIMDECRMARKVLMADVNGGQVRGRQRFGWMDGMKVAFRMRVDYFLFFRLFKSILFLLIEFHYTFFHFLLYYVSYYYFD